jgi:hypothetical protein
MCVSRRRFRQTPPTRGAAQPATSLLGLAAAARRGSRGAAQAATSVQAMRHRTRRAAGGGGSAGVAPASARLESPAVGEASAQVRAARRRASKQAPEASRRCRQKDVTPQTSKKELARNSSQVCAPTHWETKALGCGTANVEKRPTFYPPWRHTSDRQTERARRAARDPRSGVCVSQGTVYTACAARGRDYEGIRLLSARHPHTRPRQRQSF